MGWRRWAPEPAAEPPVSPSASPHPECLHAEWVAAKTEADRLYTAWGEASKAARIAENALLKAKMVPPKPPQARKGR